MPIQYRHDKDGRAVDFSYFRNPNACPDGYSIIESDRVPDDISQYHTQEYIAITTQETINMEARDFLSEGGRPGQSGTGWKIIRHRDQLDAGTTASLTEDQYRELLLERQQKRDSIIEV